MEKKGKIGVRTYAPNGAGLQKTKNKRQKGMPVSEEL
jgi:hypothetical protein